MIAFYLPQYHAIPENDKAWGKGFTEWTNVKKAVPFYKGQVQPHVPLHEDYYNLLDETVMRKQAKQAKEYGIYGFCFYHYYFKNGKKLLEKPLENMLKDKEVDIPFCLSWANEPWSRRWDGSETEIIVEQDYGGEEEWKKHFEYLLPFFMDHRYIRDEKTERPIFILYKPKDIPQVEKMLAYWNRLAKEQGLHGLKYFVQFPELECIENRISAVFEGIIEFEPVYTVNSLFQTKRRKRRFMVKHPLFTFSLWKNRIYNKLFSRSRHIYSYDMVVEESLKRIPGSRNYPGVFPSWDNTPRRGENASFYSGSSPEKFEEYLEKKILENRKIYKKDMIFINAWNEWAEGAYLEPDEEHGFAYLEAVKRVLGK